MCSCLDETIPTQHVESVCKTEKCINCEPRKCYYVVVVFYHDGSGGICGIYKNYNNALSYCNTVYEVGLSNPKRVTWEKSQRESDCWYVKDKDGNWRDIMYIWKWDSGLDDNKMNTIIGWLRK